MRRRRMKMKIRGGDDTTMNISNTGDLLSRVGPPTNYAYDPYNTVLENTPVSTAATMNLSISPGYDLEGENYMLIDPQLTAGGAKKKKGLKGEKSNKKKRNAAYSS